MINNMQNQNNQNANSVTPMSGATELYPNNPQNQQNSQINEQQETQQNVQANGENQNKGVSQQSPSQDMAQQSLRNNSTGNSRSLEGTSNDDYNYFEVEQKLMSQIEKIQQNANSYGQIVEVVGRRSVISESDGRGNGFEFEYKLSDGRIVSNDQAWELANAGKIKNVIGSHNHGRKYIRSVGDGVTDNNLGNLPTF